MIVYKHDILPFFESNDFYNKVVLKNIGLLNWNYTNYVPWILAK